MRAILLLVAVSFGLSTAILDSHAGEKSKPADWPQWRGPHRDGISTETGLLKQWPKGGPALLWDSRTVNQGTSVGVGFSSLAIVQGKIFTMGDRAVPKRIEIKKGDKIVKKTLQDGNEFVFCLDADTGKEIWKTAIGPASSAGPAGPRCTPTVDGDRVYALTPQGALVCLKTVDGAIVWRKNFGADFGGAMMSGWAYSESPTIDGDRLICTPGGKDAAMVALDKKTGQVIWKCQIPVRSGAGYASIVTTEAGGVKQYITILGAEMGLIGVNAQTGKFLWNYRKIANGTANIPTPLVKGELVFAATGYNKGAALLKLSSEGEGGVKAEEAYFLKGADLQNHHGGMVMIGDHIYGGHGHNDGLPFCLEWKSGEFAWGPRQGPGQGSAAVLFADGHLYFRYQSGEMALIEATPKGYTLKGSFRVPIAGNGWPHPVIYNGRLYLRGNDQILCYDIRNAK